MKHAYVPILVALILTSGAVSRDAGPPASVIFNAPAPVSSAPLDQALVHEVSLTF